MKINFKNIVTFTLVFLITPAIYLCVLQPSAYCKDMLDKRQVASNQEIQCTFDAEILGMAALKEKLPSEQYLKGYLIDKNPKWKLILKVLPHSRKIPFQPGIRECYIKDPQLVFGTSAKKVSGKYRFSYVWHTGEGLEFSNFKAAKIK